MTEEEHRLVRLALAYVAGTLFLRKAEREGRLADDRAIDAELKRTLDTLEHALRLSN